MPAAMSCSSCGKAVQLRPLECLHCKAVQPEAAGPSGPGLGVLAVVAVCLLAGGALGYLLAAIGGR